MTSTGEKIFSPEHKNGSLCAEKIQLNEQLHGSQGKKNRNRDNDEPQQNFKSDENVNIGEIIFQLSRTFN